MVKGGLGCGLSGMSKDTNRSLSIEALIFT